MSTNEMGWAHDTTTAWVLGWFVEDCGVLCDYSQISRHREQHHIYTHPRTTAQARNSSTHKSSTYPPTYPPIHRPTLKPKHSKATPKHQRDNGIDTLKAKRSTTAKHQRDGGNGHPHSKAQHKQKQHLSTRPPSQQQSTAQPHRKASPIHPPTLKAKRSTTQHPRRRTSNMNVGSRRVEPGGPSTSAALALRVRNEASSCGLGGWGWGGVYVWVWGGGCACACVGVRCWYGCRRAGQPSPDPCAWLLSLCACVGALVGRSSPSSSRNPRRRAGFSQSVCRSVRHTHPNPHPTQHQY